MDRMEAACGTRVPWCSRKKLWDCLTESNCAPAAFACWLVYRTLCQLRLVSSAIRAERVDVAHVHACSQPLLLHWVCRRVPTIVTCHLPLCPNGARDLYKHERICNRRVGAGCLVGHHRHGCGQTADERPFGIPGMLYSLLLTKIELAILQPVCACYCPEASGSVSVCWQMEYRKERLWQCRRRFASDRWSSAALRRMDRCLLCLLWHDCSESKASKPRCCEPL